MRAYIGRFPLVLSVVLVGAFAAGAGAQQQRRQHLDRSTTTTDDPRRIPMPAGYSPWEGNLVIVGGRVFDGTGAPARQATVVVEGNRIARISAPADADWPQDAVVVDAAGKTVLPGLIDLHVHLSYDEPGVFPAIGRSPADQALRGMERLRVYIQSGITSVRDTGSDGDVPFRLKDWVAAHRLPGPRVFAAGQLITGTGGHGAEGVDEHSPARGTIREASGPEDWRNAVREQLKAGADLIKIASHFTTAEAAAAVEEAHDLGIRVTADAETFYIDRAIEAGVDIIEHPLPRTDGTIQRMVDSGTMAVPTLIPYVYIFDMSGGYFGSTSRRFTFSKQANFDVLRRLREAGVKIGVGTDLIAEWFRYLPSPYIRELEFMIEAGMSIPEALVAATRTGAEILDMDDKLGTIEVGKLADVIVVDGRPDERIRDLANVVSVVRDGELVVQEGRVLLPVHLPTAEPEPGEAQP